MDDTAIIALYWDRNEQAIPATADKYGNYCASIARNILTSPEDVEECVNDTYLGAWNAMPPHKPTLLSAFLGKITRNLSFNRYKRNHADKRGGNEIPAVLEELAGCVSGKEDIVLMFERKELVAAINDFLETLSPQKRGVFVCRYWYADSISDIVARYGMGYSAVTTLLNRLRIQLRTFLTDRGYEL